MVSKNGLIFRDALYAVLIIVILWPGVDSNMAIWVKILIAGFAFGLRVLQHVTYYKATGKIY